MPRLFHYTTGDVARAIIDGEEEFGLQVVVGAGNAHGDGFYATDIAPTRGPEGLEDVIATCFGGGRSEAEVSWVLVLRSSFGDYEFESTADPAQWLIPESPMAVIYVSEGLEFILRFIDGDWEQVWRNRELY